MQITSNVFQIGGARDSHPNDAAIYLIKDKKHSAIVDTGTGAGTARVLENLRDCGVEPSTVSYILITHCHFDHVGGINALRKATGAQVVTHRNDAVFLESADADVTGASWYGYRMEITPVDIKADQERQEFPLDDLVITMHYAPGHSPGSSVFTLFSDGKLVLFGQDVHGPINDILRSNRREYERSLEYLMSLNADILCEGHFGVFTGKEKIREFIESYL
jgi:glyoxylase-like metal-dependent hydrolase (beta-lactamase superfamily II)